MTSPPIEPILGLRTLDVPPGAELTAWWLVNLAPGPVAAATKMLKLMGCGLQVLEETATGRLTRKQRRFLVLNAPACCIQAVKEYAGGAFDPEKRGTAYLVAGEVDGATRVNNSDAKFGLSPMGLVNSSATSQPFLRKVPCSFRARGKHSAPDTNFTAYKYYLEEPDFLAPTVDDFFALEEHPSAAAFLALDDRLSATEPSAASTLEASEPAPDPPEASEANLPADSAASKPAGTS